MTRGGRLLLPPLLRKNDLLVNIKVRVILNNGQCVMTFVSGTHSIWVGYIAYSLPRVLFSYKCFCWRTVKNAKLYAEFIISL